ncbi:MAG: hypothetical protein ACREOG_22405, partial [Gemmatimonadaceae bacterium]
VQRILYQKLDKPENAGLTDLNRRELALLVPILACILWLGVYPKPVLTRMEASARGLVQQVETKAARQTLTTLGGGR